MSDLERSRLAHAAAHFASKLTEGEREERVQNASYMVGYYRSLAEQVTKELQRAAGTR